MIRLGSTEQFRVLREYLNAEFTETHLCTELSIPTLVDFHSSAWKPPQDPLVSLLFVGAIVPPERFASRVPAPVFHAMRELGILEESPNGVHASALLYPFEGLHIASDRFTSPDASQGKLNRDFVYFALTRNTQRYMASLPIDRCEAFLDVGAGSGAAALAQAKIAGRVWAADIDARCTLYAKFNRALNGIENAEVVEGSIYEPVNGLTFDRIGCHPPYDINVATNWVFADGGDDGEVVVRGSIEGLPQVLRPGGRFYALARLSERKGASAERRIREWLGSKHAEFDVALVVIDTIDPADVAAANVLSSSDKTSDMDLYFQRFQALGIEQMVYTHIVVARHESPSKPLTLRRGAGTQVTGTELNWLIDWERAAPDLDLQTIRFLMSPRAEIITRHAMKNGALDPLEYRVCTSHPFMEDEVIPSWIAQLIGQCNGLRGVEELHKAIHQAHPVSSDQVEGALKRLMSLGVLLANRTN